MTDGWTKTSVLELFRDEALASFKEKLWSFPSRKSPCPRQTFEIYYALPLILPRRTR